jgi:hypothetical protein
MRLVATDPPNGAGLDCELDDPACGVPTDVTLALHFDRFLLPETAIRQSVTMYTGSRGNVAPPPSSTRPELTPQYDPLERTVRYLLPPGYQLHPHALYTVELPIYSDAQPLGFRAFDGAPLAGQSPILFSFRTGSGPALAPAATPDAPSCSEFLGLVESCAFLSCHGDAGPKYAAARMGLLLDTAAGVRDTAVARVAHQTETSDTTGITNQAPPRFGTNMPIIDPGRPENSYLLYKLLIGVTSYLPEERGGCPTGDRCEPPSPDEIGRLRAWFVRGEPMPLAENPNDPAERFIHRAEAERIQAFIAQGDGCLDDP